MPVFRWTKQQDFCLRLGLLKAVAFIIGRDASVSTRDPVLRKIEEGLLRQVEQGSERHKGVEAKLSMALPPKDSVAVATALLILGDASSWGQPLKSAHKGKLLDWAQSFGIVGKGYRLTERGGLFVILSDPDQIGLTADFRNWNPMLLSLPERALFLYHLHEFDKVTMQVARRIGKLL
jgi:hypothetical protein